MDCGDFMVPPLRFDWRWPRRLDGADGLFRVVTFVRLRDFPDFTRPP
jgi:hypothetical protein